MPANVSTISWYARCDAHHLLFLCLAAPVIPVTQWTDRGVMHSADQAIKDLEPVTRPFPYSGMTNLRRLYEDINLPEGLAIVGDSLAAFNPVELLPQLILSSDAGTSAFLLARMPLPGQHLDSPPMNGQHGKGCCKCAIRLLSYQACT